MSVAPATRYELTQRTPCNTSAHCQTPPKWRVLSPQHFASSLEDYNFGQVDEDSRRLIAEDLVPDEAISSEDDDRFDHKSLARVVGDAIRSHRDDTSRDRRRGWNVALYGSWGSGKSGFLQLLKDNLGPPDASGIKVVRYDAWKYEGDALQRQFLSQAASELDVKLPDLYAAEEGKRIDPQPPSVARLVRIGRWSLKWALAATIAAGLFLFLLGLGLALEHHFIDEHKAGQSLWDEIQRQFELQRPRFLKYVLAPAVIFAVAAAALQIVLSEAVIGYRRDAPTEEEFEAVFADLLERARSRQHNKLTRLLRTKQQIKRFVFFVDELDRCSKEEVVATLRAIKNFLGQSDCIFIVAADRDVLEEALTALPQSNPANVEAPYYSSASEFLDKIFQLQLELPPLRTQRRTRFARELVETRTAGVWAALRQGGVLDNALFVLIPAHVQSPRRIKTLLTNFAMNARATEARGLNWLERADEIAKLTAFQTEFPLFARDLPQEPRLPTWLLHPPAMMISPQKRALLNHHKLPSDDITPQAATVTVDTEDLEPTDRVLGETTKAERQELIHEQRAQLRRYLEARESYENPRRDLLYLSSVGEFVGLEDPDLAAAIETAASENSAEVGEALQIRATEEVEGAVRLLASFVTDYRGPEQDNVVKSLFAALRLLDQPFGKQVALVAASALGNFIEIGDVTRIEDDSLALAVEVAVYASEAELAAGLLADERTLGTADDVQRVARFYDRLPSQKAEIVEKVIEFFPDAQNVLFDPLRTLPEPEAEELLSAAFVETVEAVLTAERAETADREETVADQLLEASMGNSPRLAGIVFDTLLDLGNSTAYRALTQRGEAILGVPAEQPKALELALRAFAQGSPSDWNQWLKLAEDARSQMVEDADRAIPALAVTALSALFTKFDVASDDLQSQSPELIRRVVKIADIGADDLGANRLAEALGEALGGGQWSSDPAASAVQMRLHVAIRALRSPLPDGIDKALLDDLLREAQPTPVVSGVTPPQTFLASVARVAEIASPSSAKEVAETIASTESESTDRTVALLILGASLNMHGEDVHASDWFALSTSEIVKCVRQEGTTALTKWLETRPPVDAAVPVIRGLGGGKANVEAVRAWAHRESREFRTQFVQQMIERQLDASLWIAEIRDIDEKAIADCLSRLVSRKARARQRALLTRSMIALDPTALAARVVVADFLISLFDQRTKADFRTAIGAMSALGGKAPEGRVRALGNAVGAAAKATGLKAPTNAVEAFGLHVSKKYLD
jgi:hypothetical protein